MKKKLLYHLRMLISQSSILVGGQAVMEGVMMRVPGAYADKPPGFELML